MNAAFVPTPLYAYAGSVKLFCALGPEPAELNDVIPPLPSTPVIEIVKSFVASPPNSVPLILITSPTMYPASVAPAFSVTV